MRKHLQHLPRSIGWLVRQWVTLSDFHCVRRPRDVIYFLKAVTNSFQTLISKFFFPKYIFWKCILCKNIFAMCTRLTHLLSFASSFLLPLRTLFLFNHLKTSINFQKKTIHTSFSWHFSEYSQEQLPDMCEKYISSERRESEGRKVYLF